MATKLANLINPQVMSDMIESKIDAAIVVTPFAKLDTTLHGRPGDTITVPKYNYIGDAVDVAEGASVEVSPMSAVDVEYKVKKAMKAVTLTDEAVLAGYGNPVGEATQQLAKSIASKADADAIAALCTSTNAYTTDEVISYDGIVDAIDIFNEELNTAKVIFVHPKQMTQLRHDTDFISADKYDGKVVMSGEIGKIAGCSVVPSRRVKLVSGKYQCPIVKIETDVRSEDELPAITIFMKRDTNLETQRHTLNRTTDISVDKNYVAALTNEGKVVLASFAATQSAQGS